MVSWSQLADAPAITLHGERLASAIVKRVKPLENRTFKIKGWVWIHAGQAKDYAKHAAIVDKHTSECPEDPGLRGCIIGAAHFHKTVDVTDAKGDERLKDWTFGPQCSLIDAAFLLDAPVPASGKLSLWKKDMPYEALRKAFNARVLCDAARLRSLKACLARAGKRKVLHQIDAATRMVIREAQRDVMGLRNIAALRR